MSNLIITVIAIGLIALASLMTVYYAGTAYLDNESIAGAGTFVAQSQQVASAFQAYFIDNANVFPAAWTDLTGGSHPYLQAVPVMQIAPNVNSAPLFIAAVGAHYYAYASLGRPVTPGVFNASAADGAYCAKLIKYATGHAITGTLTAQPLGTISSTAGGYGNGTFGCAPTSDTFPANNWGTPPAITDYIAEFKVY